jgi:hypothetical protein
MQRMWGEVETMNEVKFIVELQTFSTIAPKSFENFACQKSTPSRSEIYMDVDTLKKITNYCNWIPLMRGLHLEFIENAFPGWEWNDFAPKLIKRKILHYAQDGEKGLTNLSQGLCISSDIQAIQFIPYKSGVRIKVLTIKKIVKPKELETA